MRARTTARATPKQLRTSMVIIHHGPHTPIHISSQLPATNANGHAPQRRSERPTAAPHRGSGEALGLGLYTSHGDWPAVRMHGAQTWYGWLYDAAWAWGVPSGKLGRRGGARIAWGSGAVAARSIGQTITIVFYLILIAIAIVGIFKSLCSVRLEMGEAAG